MDDGFLGWGENGECQKVTFDETPPPSSNGVKISASVGINGKNIQTDVKTIQQALNGVPASQGRPLPPLKEDGVCGPKTKDAIQKFQIKHFGWSGADGRADPNGQTVAKLNQLNGGGFGSTFDDSVAFGGGAAGAPSEPDPVIGAARVARIQGLIGQARSCIRAAQMNATMATPVVNSAESGSGIFPSLSRASIMRLLNTHFEIDLFPKPQRLQAVTKVLQTFNLMESVFQRPGGLWGAAVFDYDRLDKPYYAYTYSQGYYRPGEKLWTAKMQVRRDAIYFCKKIDTVSDDMAILGIVHELSHFVGHPERIRDKAYGWTDSPKMKKLMPSQKLYNAMNYSNYAFEAQYGRRPAGY